MSQCHILLSAKAQRETEVIVPFKEDSRSEIHVPDPQFAQLNRQTSHYALQIPASGTSYEAEIISFHRISKETSI